MDKEKLYLKLPVFLQHIGVSYIGWRVKRERFGGQFDDYLADAERRTYWSPEDIRTYRNRRLQSFIGHIASSVPYYRRKFSQWGIDPDEVNTLDDLKRIPILTKEEIQAHYPEMISEAIPKNRRIVLHTSGTTGGGLCFATTRSAIQEQYAVWWRYRRWHGIPRDIWYANFGGRSIVPLSQNKPPYWRVNYPGKQIQFSGYHMSADTLGDYVAELKKRQVHWLHGYPSLLALLAIYVVENGIEFGNQIRWVTIGAENLLSSQSEMIEQAFGVPPLQHYGMVEGVANISECEKGRLHVDEDYSAVEFIPNPDGPGYRIIGTAFTNYAVPFLRYDVQDIVSLDESKCSCGRPGRVISSLDGRHEDYIILRNGSKLGRMDHIFKDMINIQEAQIVQREPGEIIYRIVRGESYTDDDERLLLKETKKRVGDSTGITVRYVDQLPRSESGKLRFVISEVEQGQLEHTLE
jgi:phenylacetate-CoA ligase